MDRPFYKSKEEVLEKAKSANGHLISDFNVDNWDLNFGNKGIIGQIIERGLFGYPLNNKSEPDFAKLGVELKVTGLKKLRNNSFVAKERLVLNIIDYFHEAKTDFERSAFWNKNKNLLLMFYLYNDLESLNQYKIIDSILFTYPEEDLKIIKDDWEFINKKIKEGNAHLISEADTMYLAACTKGANGEAVRLQPFSTVKAKQRAFCLKSSYINQIVRKNLIDEKCEKILNVEAIKNSTFETAIESKVQPFKGKSEKELRNKFSIKSNSKNIFELITSKMFDIKGKINKSDEFLKANITVKTIRLEEDNKIIESMSFPTFKFEDIVKETWGESELRNMFYETKYMFVIFKKTKSEYLFDSVKFWNIPIEILDNEVYQVWKKTKEVIEKGEIVFGVRRQKNGKSITLTNFPGMSFNGVCHVRPHAKNAMDTYDLPVADKTTGLTSFTKQCFWLNNAFIVKIIK